VVEAVMVATPLTGSVPLQPSLPLPPDAVQLVTPVELQLSTKLPPGATVEGAGGMKVTVGVGPPLEEEPLDELPPEDEPELPEELDELLPEELELPEEEEEELPLLLLLPELLLSLLQPANSVAAPSIEMHKLARSRSIPVPRFIVESP
jgi:hypothetical protein